MLIVVFLHQHKRIFLDCVRKRVTPKHLQVCNMTVIPNNTEVLVCFKTRVTMVLIINTHWYKCQVHPTIVNLKHVAPEPKKKTTR